jgi:hypothetical protein
MVVILVEDNIVVLLIMFVETSSIKIKIFVIKLKKIVTVNNSCVYLLK